MASASESSWRNPRTATSVRVLAAGCITAITSGFTAAPSAAAAFWPRAARLGLCTAGLAALTALLVPPQLLDDVLVSRQPAALAPVGVQHAVGNVHLEEPPGTLFEIGHDAERLLYLSRQTGGCGVPASLVTVDDLDLRGFSCTVALAHVTPFGPAPVPLLCPLKYPSAWSTTVISSQKAASHRYPRPPLRCPASSASPRCGSACRPRL